jgi:hypothetical protein
VWSNCTHKHRETGLTEKGANQLAPRMAMAQKRNHENITATIWPGKSCLHNSSKVNNIHRLLHFTHNTLTNSQTRTLNMDMSTTHTLAAASPSTDGCPLPSSLA